MNRKKICLISSSGGHYEQLKRLSVMGEKNDIFWVTEKTNYAARADYYLVQTGGKDVFFIFKMIINLYKSLIIWLKEKPDYIITTGTMVVIPLCLIAKLFKRKVIYIETFACAYDGTRTGKFLYKHVDLFIVQWEELLKVYPDAVFGGSIY